jgi:hypothetical protein
MSSKLFNYSSGLKETLRAATGYIPGRITTTGYKLVESAATDKAKPVEYGEVVKYDATELANNRKVAVPMEVGDTADLIKGIIVRTYNQISNVQYADNVNQFVYSPPAGQTVSILRKGFIAAPVQDGTPVVDGDLSVRVQASAALPIGGIEATVADGTNLLAVPQFRFDSGPGFPMNATNTTNTGDGTGQTAVVAVDFTL